MGMILEKKMSEDLSYISENGIDNALLFSIATKWAIKFRIHKIGINFVHMCLEVQCFLYLGVGLDYS